MNDGAAQTAMSPRSARFGFCLYDFANSAYYTIAINVLGAAYFEEVLAAGRHTVNIGGIELGTKTAWGAFVSISMALVTLTGPLSGALADGSARKRLFLASYTTVAVLALIGLGLTPRGATFQAFMLYIVANVATEGGYVFYNAFLPELAPGEKLGRLSGTAWACGYIGGLIAAAACLPLLPRTFAGPDGHAGSVGFFVAAAWFGVFGGIAIVLLKEKTRRHAEPVRIGEAFRRLRGTMKAIGAMTPVLVFLAAYFFYNDAITTFIEFTSSYTKNALGFLPADNTRLFLVLNVVAVPGTLFFGWLVDKIGARRSIMITLVLWIIVVVGCALARTKGQFWPVAGLAALVTGSTQACSRTMMASLAPKDRSAEFMGFLALSGKGSAIFGPALYGIVADYYADPGDAGHGQRIAVLVLGSFFLIGLVLISFVRERRAEESAPVQG